jgi:hypothetical protein
MVRFMKGCVVSHAARQPLLSGTMTGVSLLRYTAACIVPATLSAQGAG